MDEKKFQGTIKSSIEEIKNLWKSDLSVGSPIVTTSGMTLIPISKVSVAFACGGADFSNSKILSKQNFGGGGGSTVTVTPMGFLTVDKDSRVELINLNGSNSPVDKILSLIENSPAIIEKIKKTLS